MRSVATRCCACYKLSPPVMRQMKILKSIISICVFGITVSQADPTRPGDPKDLTPPSAQSKSSDIRVMSFNIRLGIANDGPNHWDLRKGLVVKAIQHFNPDFLGTQETHPFQAQYLIKSFPEHAYYGVGRMEDPKTGEQCGVMFRKERFKLLDKGTFWLSETPKEPGSKSWDSSLPRIASWVKLRDKNDEQQELVFINTHFDHRGRQARIEAAKLIRKRVAKLGTKTRVIITGDFNAGEGSLPYKSLVGANPDYSVKLIDTYRSANPEPAIGGEGTLSAWSGRRSSNRIDWVLHSPHFRTKSASIDYFNENGRYPSDHYPVSAVITPCD